MRDLFWILVFLSVLAFRLPRLELIEQVTVDEQIFLFEHVTDLQQLLAVLPEVRVLVVIQLQHVLVTEQHQEGLPQIISSIESDEDPSDSLVLVGEIVIVLEVDELGRVKNEHLLVDVLPEMVNVSQHLSGLLVVCIIPLVLARHLLGKARGELVATRQNVVGPRLERV